MEVIEASEDGPREVWIVLAPEGLPVSLFRPQEVPAQLSQCGGAGDKGALHLHWVVERTITWLARYRRLCLDFEPTVASSMAHLEVALIHFLVQRLGILLNLQLPS